MSVKKHIVLPGRLVLIVLTFLAYSGMAQDYYWRGGTGNWSDPSNWSSSSGGIPTAFDNVVFDDASFSGDGQVVTINIDAECRNMDWSGVDKAPRLDGEMKLTINGSVHLHPNMKVLFTGDIHFTAQNGEQSIDFAGHQIHSNLFFKGKGQWNFSSDIDVGESDISLVEGVIDTKGKKMICGSFISIGQLERRLKLNASTIQITGFNGRWKVNSKLDLQKGSSLITISNPNPLSMSVFKGGSRNYHRVEFINNVDVLGNNTFDFLKLNAGFVYKLESGKTQTINQSLSARGCAGLIDIKASENGRAILKKTSGDIQLSFVRLQSVEAMMGSGAVFNAYYSIDNGNNLNCNIYINSREMHWSGGTGRWSDTLRWNAVSAGANSKCVPLPYDDVFFDDNSFSGTDTVKVDMIHSYCNDMIWTSTENAVLTNLFDSSQIVLYGSLQFAAQMQNLYKGVFSFRDTVGNQTIKSNGASFAGDLNFSGENGRWDLMDATKVYGTINFHSGTLNSNNYPVSCNRFVSDSSLPRTLNLGTSLLKIENRTKGPGLLLNNNKLTFNQSKLQVEIDGNEPMLKIFGGDTIRFYQVSFTSITGMAKLRNDSTYSIFQKLSFASDGDILGNNMFDSIMLSKACVYSLHSGRTQTIRNEIIAPGSCEGTLILKSSKNGSQAKLKMLGDTLLIKYISLRDIRALPGAVYIAKKAVDLGNNLGWAEITGTEQRELYWVDGSGDWNDVQHWSLASDGPGGECVPTPKDIVYFDQNSFPSQGKEVTVELRNAFAYDLTWSDAVNNPVFVSNEFTALRVFGSLELTEHMDFNFMGPLYFESSEAGKTIRTKGLKFENLNNSFYFDGFGGEWTLMNDLNLGSSDTVKNSINLINGSIITNNKAINCFSFISNSSSERSLSLGNSDINLSKNWVLNGRNMNLDAGLSHLNIESGYFLQRFAENIQYNDVLFKSDKKNQKLLVTDSDTVRFRNISFNRGELSGEQSHVFAENIHFRDVGSINIWDSTLMNVYSIGKLFFNSAGQVFGNDTISEVHFDSIGTIRGKGEYQKVLFADDGDIYGSNLFGTLSFAPGHVYQLEGEKTQTISDQFDIWGNNCESIWLQSTSEQQAEIFKATDTVFGEFIEMSNIKASGGAYFDAGSYSTDINLSNTGWVFHDTPWKYQLDSITTDFDDTLVICASNFNVGPGTTYLWQKYPDGDTVGTEYCLKLPPYNMGYYTLSVFYDDDGGCVKYDTLLWGCFYSMDINNTDVSCYGYSDGAIDVKISDGTGAGPYEVLWYQNEDTIAHTPYLDNLPKGTYTYSVTDKEGCTVFGTTAVEEPDSMSFYFNVDYNQNVIELEVEGGTNPYTYLWETGSDEYYADIEDAGNYTVLVTDDNNCTKTGAVFVDNRFNVLAPNAFTPNGDGLNDYFNLFWQGPEILNYRLDIFASWGNLVFGTDNFDEFWNGKLFNQGDLLPTGVYSWRVVVVSYDGKKIVEHGTVTLLR